MSSGELMAVEVGDLSVVGLSLGVLVGARRWAYHHAHHDCWMRPWQGVILSRLEPRSWAGTLAFRDLPEAEDVRKHVQYFYSRDLLRTSVPVLWDFGEAQKRVYWETLRGAFGLRHYADDLAEWTIARERARTPGHSPSRSSLAILAMA